MFEDLIAYRNVYRNKIAKKQVDIEQAIKNNSEREILLSQVKEKRDLLDGLEEYKQALAVVQAAVDQESLDFQNRRLDFLNETITSALTELLPHLGLQASIECDFSRKDKASLVLKDSKGHSFSPDMSAGTLVQYLVSFAAVSCITQSLGYKNIFIDEAFGAAAVDLLGDIGALIQKRVDAGIQIVLVSQNPALYRDLPRHEIFLETDFNDLSVKVTEKDY